MKTNTFFISDASYCEISKTATVASLCPMREIKETRILKNIQSIKHAETSALLLSIKLAIKYNIKNAVFIYDNNSIEKYLIENTYKEHFDCIQLLWVKRDLIKPADKAAKDVFKKLVYPEVVSKNSLQKKTSDMVNFFKSYDDDLKIKAALRIATIKEHTVLNTFLNNKYKLNSLHEVNLKNTTLMKFVYQVLSLENRKKFYEYLSIVSPKVKKTVQFRQMQKNEVLLKYIKLIVEKSAINNDLLERKIG